ncbi:MAG TPA: dihydrofolate reductase [Lacipirellulaceae bacterium]|jgi:dihydrofolate reductase|nr:dihydrofolate reductase [Lacipirellulaceae bacterium]
MLVSIIAAVAENGVIGRDGKLPWHLSADLRRFKQLTMGHTVIMGRRTWESIGRSLPGRRMIVISRQPDYHVEVASVDVATSLDGALALARAAGDDEAFIIGGGALYREALPQVDRLYYTAVRADVPGDAYFPDVEWSQWRLIESHEHVANEVNDFATDFEIYHRRAS